jgi:F-type H+-transporting ATPase subunit epsilon
MAITLEIVTPEKRLLSVECDEVRAPGLQGGFGIRPRHAPFLSALRAGELIYTDAGREHRFAIGGGFLQVADDKVIVLADTAEPKEEIDLERAKRTHDGAKAKLSKLTEGDPEYIIEMARVERAAARIFVAAH